ncbi:MAG: bifunctional 3-(3-hydroxy-phenyl)propionate/3-hydroxycinnamic acid hydroxylase [Myxococcota bacterium]
MHDVVIVGYGPVGAVMALQLAHAGLRVLILERGTEPLDLPRAVGLDGETARMFQRLGIGDEMAKLYQPPREGDAVWFTNSKHEPLFGMEMPLHGANGWRDMVFFDQPELEAALRQVVAAEPRIEVRLGRKVTELGQDADRVQLTSTAVDGDDPQTHEGAWAIGCDGASSFVRETLGIEWESLGYDQDWLVIDVIQKPGAGLPGVTMQVCDPARLATYVCVKDPNRRWEFQVLPGETREEMLRPEKIRELLDPWTSAEYYDLRRAAVYQFHAANAAAWRAGRVFLAGDAAHQTPPFLGQGLNAGFRDAVNLGWKIPLVHAGLCEASLLDSYAEERDAHARDLVDWAVAIGKLMETLAAREAGLPDPYQVDQSSGYGQGRTAPPLRGGVLMAANDDTSAVGVQLRQPSVREKGGRAERLDAFLGDGFAIVGQRADDIALGAEAAAVWERLGGTILALEDFELTEGEWDYALDQHPALLVRPDRFLFGGVDADTSLDDLVFALARKLGLRDTTVG